MNIFEVAFGEKKNDNFRIGEDLKKGVKKVVGDRSLGKSQISIVGYKNEEAVSIGTLKAKKRVLV